METIIDDLRYELNDNGTASLEGYVNGNILGDKVVPSNISHNGKVYIVTSLGDSCFENCCKLTSITIPDSVTSLGNSCFSGCSGLNSITIPKSVTSLGIWCFSGCSGLTSITVEQGNPVYDSREHCNAIIETESNTMIWGCKSTTIPSSVNSLGDGCFQDCSGLISINIPKSVTSLENAGIEECSGLTSITVEQGNPIYDSREHCNAIILTESNSMIAGCKNTIIPNSVTSLGSECFKGCSGLTSIAIPQSVTSLGSECFKDCSGLTSITIPDGCVNSTVSIAISQV